MAEPAPPKWLLLILQLPPKPDYLRVKVRRRLRKIGAEPIRDAVYVLANSEASMEDFLWLCREIRSEGGEAHVVEGTFVDGFTDEKIAALLSRTEPAPPSGTGNTWVTRANVYVDRIASAWLIRRFIDPAADFKFVAGRRYRPGAGEIRFDMFDGEYTHEGDRCTFEVLLVRHKLTRNRSLRAIAEIVHDLDLKDERFERPETPGVARLLDALVASTPDDSARLERGAQLFGDLYASFEDSRPTPSIDA